MESIGEHVNSPGERWPSQRQGRGEPSGSRYRTAGETNEKPAVPLGGDAQALEDFEVAGGFARERVFARSEAHHRVKEEETLDHRRQQAEPGISVGDVGELVGESQLEVGRRQPGDAGGRHQDHRA